MANQQETGRCVTCRGPLPPSRGGRPRKYCSRECDPHSHPEGQRHAPGAQNRVREIRHCPQCGSEYLARRAGRKFCSVACHGASRSALKKVYERKGPFQKECEVCGSEFLAKRRFEKFCSPHCRSYGSSLRGYGIDGLIFRQMLKAQGGCCASCGVDLSDIRICVDHCHTGGHVRGLLCSGCNIAAGHFEKRGQEVMAYLARDQLDLRDLCIK